MADHLSLRAALFVDFDNVYSQLSGLDRTLAENFATDPASWVSSMSEGTYDGVTYGRRFLVQNCYLNPSVFSTYRAFWTRAGFRVVDCPSLTRQGKSSADINLVLDAVDALDGPARYDEFIIASADADFTSLVRRCRAADRLVTVITAGPVASAYRSVADTVLEVDHFTETSMFSPEMSGEESLSSPIALAPTLTPQRRVTPDGEVSSVQHIDSPTESKAAQQAVWRAVKAAQGPITGAAAAHAARLADSNLASGWGGYPNFGAWLENELPAVGYSSVPSPGYAWDPDRFSEDDLPENTQDQLSELPRQIARLTGVPGLSQDKYRLLLEALADDVAESPFDRTGTSKRVRDTCQARGASIGRNAINTVIRGLLYSGAILTNSPSATSLAEKWAANVEGLCRGARMELDDQQVAELRTWAGGGLLS